MKNIWLVDSLVLVLLSVGRAQAGDVAETNAMPAQIQNLMETQGYAVTPYVFSASPQNTNSLRNIPLADATPIRLVEIPKSKAGWKPWNNSSFRRVGRTSSPIDPFSPPFSQYEYDITYYFAF